ncbi:MAG: tol-pal system-associated acyl-CoA thioesterase [Hyphomicrobiales bacterium]
MTEGQIRNGVHSLSLRVYYEDTDFSGNVYHANYLKFCERARSDFLRVAGIDQNAMFAGGEAFVVRRMTCDFLRPARFDDLLTVETAPTEIAGARFELAQRVLRGGEALFTASVTVALIDGRGRPRRLAATMVEKFAGFAR